MGTASNTCNGSYGSDCKVYLEYKINNSEADRISRNKSNITLTLWAQATSTNVGAYNNSNNCKAYIYIDGTTKKSSTSLNMDFRNKKKVSMLSWTGDVSHNANGSLSITIKGSFDTNGPSSVTTGTVSYKWTLPTIPRTSSVTCADGNIESATTININRASSSFTHTITYSFQGLTGTIATKTSNTSIGWTIPASFYAKIPNAKSGQGTITCQTYSGSTLIGTSTCKFNAFVVNSEPDVSATIVDINTKTIALTEDNNKLIKYASNVQVAISATAKNNATIVSQKVVCGDGKTSSTATSVLEKVESGKFNISATDSRGFSTTITIEKTMVDYIKLALTEVTLTRPETTSNIVNAVIKGNYFNGNFGTPSNSLSLQWRYKEEGSTTWGSYSTLTPTIENNTFMLEVELGTEFNYKKAYDFEIVATDKVMSDTIIKKVTAGIPIIDIGKNDVIVNGQAYMGEAKILAYNANGKLVDNQGEEYKICNIVKDETISANVTELAFLNQFEEGIYEYVLEGYLPPNVMLEIVGLTDTSLFSYAGTNTYSNKTNATTKTQHWYDSNAVAALAIAGYNNAGQSQVAVGRIEVRNNLLTYNGQSLAKDGNIWSQTLYIGKVKLDSLNHASKLSCVTGNKFKTNTVLRIYKISD